MKEIQEFKDAINAELDNQAQSIPQLGGLSTSQASEWIGFRDIFAAAGYTLVAYWEAFKSEVLGIVSQGKYGTAVWWQGKMLNYQDGDPLDDASGDYLVNDDTKKIIKRVAISKNSNGTVLIKVAKANGALAGSISAGEFSRVNDYITDIKPFCTDHALISLAADEMRCVINVRYDGKLIQADMATAIQAAINGYLNNLKFDGAFNINRFRDTLEAVAGVIDVDIATVQIRPNGGAFVTVLREYAPASGYYNWLPVTGTDASVINYLPS